VDCADAGAKQNTPDRTMAAAPSVRLIMLPPSQVCLPTEIPAQRDENDTLSFIETGG
jgi:hypothetical protein